MRILLTGRNGQVGWELERALASLGEVIALDRARLDLADPAAIQRVVRDARPEVIVNAAAYTAVDRAESEPALASAVNAVAPGVFAEEALRCGALLVHYSTDYVFDGEKKTPYVEDDPAHPLNVYGRTKLEGERAIEESGCRYLILRTSWVYGPRGHNFLRTVLRLARERSELRMVDDQIGAPTSAAAIALATAEMLGRKGPEGLFHMTASGETTWCRFAAAIVESNHLQVRVVGIASQDYPVAARRPSYSLLDNGKLKSGYGLTLGSWQHQLDEVVAQVHQ
ncbi:MAG TPA: dTDP-4-dehydrorhamnose reductase [Burkholderiales bacterium]|nr:dTDP-4-dehydrorhamnose reductase [Burkholderiales bacterium]